jgi:hypothetical protein
VTHQGFFVTTVDRWSAKNRAEDPYNNGDFEPDEKVPPRLAAEELAPDDMDDLLLQAHLDNEAESEQDDNGYSEMAHLAVDEFLAREHRREIEARLARRLEEKEAGEMVLVCAGLSPKAHALHITALNDQLDGIPADLARQRAELRRKAAELAPHNLIEMIGSEPPSRGRS